MAKFGVGSFIASMPVKSDKEKGREGSEKKPMSKPAGKDAEPEMGDDELYEGDEAGKTMAIPPSKMAELHTQGATTHNGMKFTVNHEDGDEQYQDAHAAFMRAHGGDDNEDETGEEPEKE